jgi:hypothetical protein
MLEFRGTTVKRILAVLFVFQFPNSVVYARQTDASLSDALAALEAIDTEGDTKRSVIAANDYLALCSKAFARQEIRLAECQTRVSQAYTEAGLLKEADATLQLALPVLETAGPAHSLSLARALTGRGSNRTKNNEWPLICAGLWRYWSRWDRPLTAIMRLRHLSSQIS